MSVPVMVCVKATAPILGDINMLVPEKPEWRSEPIGYLRGFDTDEVTIEDNEMVTSEMAGLGLSLRYIVRSIKAEHGCRAASIAFAVEVETLEAAQKLPGFMLFGELAGPIFVITSKMANSEFRIPEDEFDGVAIKRRPVGDYYKEFEPPKYGADGSAVFSFTPFGRIGRCVFLCEDPLHLYVTNPGFLNGDIDDSAIVNLVRRYREERC